MKDLQIGAKIGFGNNQTATIIKELGRGGQGIVYLAEFNGKSYALKWYTTKPSEEFYQNLKNNCENGSPSENFIWPIAISEKYGRYFGYLMPLKPKGYYELGDFFTAKVAFKSFLPMLQAGINICNSFRKLHLLGYSYQDLNDGNFFIRPEDGSVLICDNDNVTANNTNLGIKGKSRYMAAEVINGSIPNTESDLLSMAIILYRLFMLDHPFEGQNTLKCACLTEDNERQLYGYQAVFSQDLKDSNNRPHPVYHTNSVIRWAMCPQSLKDVFCRALSKDAISNPKERVKDKEWKEIFLTLRRNLIVCTSPTGSHDFMCDNPTAISKCPCCKRKLKVNSRLAFEDGKYYYISQSKKLYLRDETKPIGEACTCEINNNWYLGMRNISQNTWTIVTASGKLKKIAENECFPLRNGMQIQFDSQNKCIVEVRQP